MRVKVKRGSKVYNIYQDRKLVGGIGLHKPAIDNENQA